MTSHASILVPLDGSKNAENAVPLASLLARLYDLPVRFIHVVEDAESVDGEEGMSHTREVFSSYAVDLAGRQGLEKEKVLAEVGYGSAAQAILSASEGVRFLVIATHGRGGFKAQFIGSVADKVIRSAKVPVATVPGVGAPMSLDKRPILVALDGSPEAEGGLEAARDLARRAGAKIVLVRAFSVPPPVGIEFAYYPPDLLTTMQTAAQEYLTGAAQPGEQTALVQGSPAGAIEQAATDVNAGLVVMTSHGKGLAARLALGSTTDRVLHSVHRPMLIVPITEESGSQ